MNENELLFNINALKEHFVEDEEMIGELVEVFVDTYPIMLKELKDSIQASDFSVMERAAHTLKGTVANFFAKGIKDKCMLLEQMGKEKNLENVETLVDELEEQMNILIEQLQNFASGQG